MREDARRVAPALTALALSLTPLPLVAQDRGVVVEVGASQVRPPSDVAGDAARFLVGGVRAAWVSGEGAGILASVLAGRAMNGIAGGDFLSGEVGASAWHHLGAGWSAGLQGRGIGYWVGSPFPYAAGAVEGGPSVRFQSADFSVRVDGITGVGRSRTEVVVPTTGGTGGFMGGHEGHMGGRGGGVDSVVSVIRNDLWRYGGTGQILARFGRVIAGATGGIHRSAGGTYESGGVRFIGGGGRVIVAARLDVWWTPFGRETTGGLTLAVPLGGRWSARGFVGRTEPDPLTLATSSGGGGGVLVGRRIVGEEPGRRDKAPLHELLSVTPSGARIRIAVAPSPSAAQVEVVGDFTLWQPRAMRRDGDRWTLELEVPAGVYHFGFLVDGEWFVPENAPDLVPDEWGRKSATLVIER